MRAHERASVRLAALMFRGMALLLTVALALFVGVICALPLMER